MTLSKIFSYTQACWLAPFATVCIWAGAAASTVFWGLRLSDTVLSPGLPTVAIVQEQAITVDAAAVARALGSNTIPSTSHAENDSTTSTRFTLQGVVWAESGEGAALLAVNDAALKPYRVGQSVGDGYTLRSITTRAVTLESTSANGPSTLTLPLPERPPGTPPIIIGTSAPHLAAQSAFAPSAESNPHRR